MIKYAILLFNLIGVMIYSLFFTDGATISVNAPKTASPASEFTVELTVKKGDVNGFAKLQQELPKGFTASELESQGASFTFSGQMVKFLWTELPKEGEFKISYRLSVDVSVSGVQSFGGKFSYLLNNDKTTIEIPATSINITESTDAAAQQTASTDNATPDKVAAQNIVCERIMPTDAIDNFVVEVTIKKGSISGFAKLQETIPNGFTATVVESGTSSFTFADQIVKFVWISLPAETDIKVSYKIAVEPKLIAKKDIEGVFSYLENDEPKKATVAKSSIMVNNMGAQAAVDVPVKTETTPVAEVKQEEKKIEEKKVEEKTPVVENKMVENTVNTSATTNIPSPQTGVNYKVQICALHSNAPVSYFKNTYSISEAINIESHEGWTKYTVGGFNEYKQARDHREIMKNKGIMGPFVTAYNIGKRITVQEALMISNQQWYK